MDFKKAKLNFKNHQNIWKIYEVTHDNDTYTVSNLRISHSVKVKVLLAVL